MKNTLHVLSLSRRAGLEVMFLNYLKYMKRYEPHLIKYQYVLGINISNYFLSELNEIGIKVYEIKKDKKFDMYAIRVARRIIKKHKIKLVYGQNFVGNTISSILGLLDKNLTIICHEHGSSWNANGIQALLTYFWVMRANYIICNSQSASIILQKKFKAKKKKLQIIYNGVPKSTKENVKKLDKRLLFVGRLEKVKSPHTLLYMMKKLVKYDNNIILDILGDGSLEEDLKKITKSLNLQSNINFYGNVEDVNEFMARSMLLILPSLRESLGNVTIEAAFQETPTIGSNVDGIPEVILNEKTGILIEPEVKLYKKVPVKKVVNFKTKQLQDPLSPSANVLANKVLKLLSNKEKTIEMGVKAREYVEQKFSINRYYNQVTNLLYSKMEK